MYYGTVALFIAWHSIEMMASSILQGTIWAAWQPGNPGLPFGASACRTRYVQDVGTWGRLTSAPLGFSLPNTARTFAVVGQQPAFW